MKNKIKKYLPFVLPLALIPEYIHDYLRFIKYSGLIGIKSNKNKIIGKIIAEYHVVEKGLTMPETRLGFGKDNIINLINNCTFYIEKFGLPEYQVEQAISVLKEYYEFHYNNSYKVDPIIKRKIEELSTKVKSCCTSKQLEFKKDDYFKYINSPFPLFSSSRKSIRNYSPNENINEEDLLKAIDLARNTPSACNRQTARVYVFSEKDLINEILTIQGGNRGFGHLSNKLIIITSELGVFHGVYEKNEAFIDGGMFAMNLLYSLHYYKIAACSLNCSISKQKDKKLRKLCKIGDSEVFIMMISCGYAPENFKSALSHRYPIDHLLTIR